VNYQVCSDRPVTSRDNRLNRVKKPRPQLKVYRGHRKSLRELHPARVNCKKVIASVECGVPVSGASKSRSTRKGVASGCSERLVAQEGGRRNTANDMHQTRLTRGAVGVRRVKSGSEDREESPENCIHLSVFVQES
jgi:hypothetical protein